MDHLSAATLVAPDLPGYDVVRLLGHGASGPVWLVREARGGRLLAAKTVRPGPQAPDAEQLLQAAQREMRIAGAITHEHVLPVHQAVTHVPPGGPATVVLLSDYAPGGSLGRLLAARGRLSVGETVTAVTPLAEALAALHAAGSVHGDLSPGNVLFTAHGKPLLADFGLGRMVGDPADAGAGTPGFVDPAAPHAEGSLALRTAADVYSAGALAWFCLTGEPPSVTRSRPPLPLLVEDVPAELAAAIEAALRESPRERPTAAEFARAVRRSAHPQPVDLAAAVDASVLPELLTRRQEGAADPRPWSLLARAAAHGRRSAGQRSGTRRAWPLWAGAGALLAATVLAGTWWIGSLGAAGPAPGGGESATPSQRDGSGAEARASAWDSLPEALRSAAESQDPVQAVQALSEVRAKAIADADAALLAEVNLPGSEAAAADEALLAGLNASGQRLAGFTARVNSATLEPQGAGAGPERQSATPGAGATAVVRVKVVTSGYAVRNAEGATVGQQPGKDQDLRIQLTLDGQRWRVSRILAA